MKKPFSNSLLYAKRVLRFGFPCNNREMVESLELRVVTEIMLIIINITNWYCGLIPFQMASWKIKTGLWPGPWTGLWTGL